MTSTIRVEHGDCLDTLRTLPDCSIDSVVTDPPYALVSIVKRFGGKNSAPAKGGKSGVYQRASRGFMGKTWDTGERAFSEEFWGEALRVLKPGGHCLAFSGTRTYHRLACAIEDAGFEIRDQMAWVYKSGFPKSHNVSKGIDKANGDTRPVTGSREAHDIRGGNLMEATQGLDRGKMTYNYTSAASAASAAWEGWGSALKPAWEPICVARKPLIGTIAANVLQYGTGALNIDGCRVGDGCRVDYIPNNANNVFGKGMGGGKWNNTQGRWPANIIVDDSEEASRSLSEFDGENRVFYSAKADAEDRCNSKHPTVKPIDLMAYLCRMVTPPGGVVLDPFAGSGSTGMACLREGFNAILCEREEEYVADIRRRIAHVSGLDTPLFGGTGTEVAGGGESYAESSRKTDRANGS